MSTRPFVHFVAVTLGLGAAVAVVACHGRSWSAVIGQIARTAHHHRSGAGFGWRELPRIEPDLSEEEALTEAIRSVLVSLPEKERRRVLTPWLPLGPRPPTVIVRPLGPDGATTLKGAADLVPDSTGLSASADGRTERHAVTEPVLSTAPATASDEIDLPAVVHALYAAHPSRSLVVAAFFVGTKPVARARARLKRAPEEITLRQLSRRLTRRERRVLGPAREAERWATLYALGWPVDRRWRITSRFGSRIHPVTGRASTHRGIDLGVPLGTQVLAPADGVVIRVARGRANGRWMEIDHGAGVRSIYCHLSRPLLKRGAKVLRGEAIAESGDTGRVTGPHLHYQLKLAGETIDPLSARIAPEVVRAPVPLVVPAAGAAQAASR